MFFQFMEGNKETDRIVPPCTGKTQEQGDISPEFAVITGQLEKCIAEVILIKVAVPAPGSIGVGEMPQVIWRTIPVVPAGAGMDMHGGAVSGNGKVFPGYESAFQGRQDGHMIKELLQALFKVKRDILPGHQPFSDRFCDLWFCLLCFLPFPFGLTGLFAVPGSGEQLIPCIQIRWRGSPKPVHEVKIRAEGRKGIRRTADEGGKDTVVSEPVHPKGKG